ncbi:P-loop containing nucleoside triphosphate hydrolase protein [Dactylonectria macrodidyma]|uniref:P-loop containing nucleoside triphosphate hydrolase protein n=1 Tax=Dactylonectria macrodidyma TaxID=307937 RepID=A0A9P9EC32_9HYPO|nr:P-loop containing nucleoside triphosphate hydrolase protein [Dactylonectria macrodidyma]
MTAMDLRDATRAARSSDDLEPGAARPAKKQRKVNKTFRVLGIPLDWDVKCLQTFLAEAETSSEPIIKSFSREAHERSNSYRLDCPGRYYFRSQSRTRFKERGGNHMWLRDALPYDLTSEDTESPIARTMTYGYESTVAESENIQNLEDLATSFHNSLLELAISLEVRPIVLVAHSLGGLIVKQTLLSLSKSQREDDKRLLQAVYGIVFFGVPHEGMDISSLIPMVQDGPNRFLIESISYVSSQILSIQQREFHNVLGGEGLSEIVCFYETVKSPTAKKDNDGNWKVDGPTAMLVTKSSATHCRSWEDGPEHICAIARTHSNMVKFGPNDDEYSRARIRLTGLTRRALTARKRIHASNAKFIVPYTANPDFVGRAGILQDIHRRLGLGKQVKPRKRVSLHGLGGVGKTQIAIAYVYWLQENCCDVSVFWVHASNKERFRDAYASIARECNIPGHDGPKCDILLLVKTWLEKQYNNQWLMVLDNADDTELFFGSEQHLDEATTSATTNNSERVLGRYLPECSHGSLLITTRNKQAGLRLSAGKPPIEISKMSDVEAHLMIRKILEDDDISMQETSSLALRLEYLPLALAQAASFVQENSITIQKYIQLLDESDTGLVERLSEPFETVGRDSETPHAVTATWIISFEKIERQNKLTSNVLSLLSLFDCQAIPRAFIENYWDRTVLTDKKRSKSAEITKILGVLQAFSFISSGKDESFDMHRLVQLATRKWLVNKGRLVDFAQDALLALSDIYPVGKYESLETQ